MTGGEGGRGGDIGEKEPENGKGPLVVGTEVVEPPELQTRIQLCSRKLSREN